MGSLPRQMSLIRVAYFLLPSGRAQELCAQRKRGRIVSGGWGDRTPMPVKTFSVYKTAPSPARRPPRFFNGCKQRACAICQIGVHLWLWTPARKGRGPESPDCNGFAVRRDDGVHEDQPHSTSCFLRRNF